MVETNVFVLANCGFQSINLWLKFPFKKIYFDLLLYSQFISQHGFLINRIPFPNIHSFAGVVALTIIKKRLFIKQWTSHILHGCIKCLNKTLMNHSSEYKIKYIDIFRKLCYKVFSKCNLRGSHWIDTKWMKQSIWNTIKNATTDQCTSISYIQDTLQTARLLLLLLLLISLQRSFRQSKTVQWKTTKSNKTNIFNLHRQYKTGQKHVAIYFYDDMSKKTYQYKRYGMKWPIVLQIYIAWPLPPSFFTSLLTSSSQWVHLTCPEASVLLNVPPGYFSFAFHY